MPYKLSPWSLADLFPSMDSPELESAFDQIEEQAAAFEGARGKLRADMPADEFIHIVQTSEEMARLAHKLGAYAGLAFAADTQDQSALTLQARVQQFMAEIGNRTLFFSLWWKGLEDAEAQRLMDASGGYRYYLEEMRHFKPHTLSEPEEKVVNIKDVTGSSALVNLYDSITNRYVFKFKVDGKTEELTRGQLMNYAYSPDPKTRAAAYRELFRVFGNDGPILGQMYQTRVRDWYNEGITLRKFKSPNSVRNLFNDVPDEAVDALLDAARKNAPVFQKFFKVKAKLLGMKKLRRYDIYAPTTASKKKYSFDAAAQMTLESFSAFTPEFGALARRVFDENHLDSEIRRGKQDGAFCASVVPEMTPYVKINYQGSARDIATLAHELGHAIHAMLASHHNLFTFHSSLPLAETASTFGEMMLIDRMLAEEKNKAVRRDILYRQVDDSYATIGRQAWFALFERAAHDAIMKNASVDEVSRIYFENLKEQFGDALDLADEFKWEWVAIPHFYHTPFYVYAYAFGKLLVLSLYKQFKAEGESFKPKYRKILAAGGSEAPAKILAEAGIDIRSAEFWQGGFDVIAEQVEELETL
ncbi:MAG: M3 family oligoendopeptidase [Anaerolineae bacterium CFX3]|nr:M3 family oligoendopeptidase [Anaerolineales bacterium]MCE7906222.1 M3 family oligoendopeptidase [Anaerolineae bacterium CFX3]MCQ3947604.1 oligoendopeptidase F [Anaerolineae bacterium]MCZ2287369.1 M3 family oligoendopeptidase [Anaerolineales bacterium]RIK27878.1 MAG: oligoendopeptidase F [Anaerolineae bacterium]